MKVESIKFECFDDFLDKVIHKDEFNLMSVRNATAFRGESSNTYTLLPSVLRKSNQHFIFNTRSDLEIDQIKGEYNLLKRFYLLADHNGLPLPDVALIRNNYSNPLMYYDHDFTKEHHDAMRQGDSPHKKWLSRDLAALAALAQHYGIPTRLLDWTFDIFIALYFASHSIRIPEKNSEYFEDDAAIIVWALKIHALIPLSMNESIPLRFVVPPYCGNVNICAQKGLLTYWEIDVDYSMTITKNNSARSNSLQTNREPLDVLLKNIYCDDVGPEFTVLYKFEFPVDDYIGIRNYIDKYGYSTSKIFPGFASVANEIKENLPRIPLKRM